MIACFRRYRFVPNFDSSLTVDFNWSEWISFLLFSAILLVFTIVCIILLMRLLMAMMTNSKHAVGSE